MVTAVIPVYNESRTIVGVVKTLLTLEYIEEIIVVDDGSTDKTADIIRNWPIKLISKSENQGKDLAVLAGAKVARSDWLLLLDGDLVGLRTKHINDLWYSLPEHRTVLGILKPQGVIGWLFFIYRYFFTRTGLRLVRRSDILSIPRNNLGKYRLESILSSQANKDSWPVKKVVLSGITHVIKEKKVGLKWGMVLRAKMIFDIITFYGEKFFRS